MTNSYCAPCSEDVMEILIESGIDFSIFFYNSNIHPVKEYEMSKKEEFYQQGYCGCVYSLRDTNRWRIGNGRERIKLGVKFYSNAMDDEA